MLHRLFPTLFVSLAALGAPVSAAPQAKVAAEATPRAALNRFIAAVKTKNLAALSHLISPSKGALYTGIYVKDEREDVLKSPKTCWTAQVLFAPDRNGFNPAREFPKIRWVLAGDRFVPSKNGKNFKKTEVFVRWTREKGAWKFFEVGTPSSGGDVG